MVTQLLVLTLLAQGKYKLSINVHTYDESQEKYTMTDQTSATHGTHNDEDDEDQLVWDANLDKPIEDD
eukprot:2190828-Ditylum_brightwellii.AAC.1